MSQGLHGKTGQLSGHELLQALERLRCSGTLVLEQGKGMSILLLQDGQLKAHHTLGLIQPLESRQLDFHFEPRATGQLPQLGSRFPQSIVPALRALPDLGFQQLPDWLDLHLLLTQVQEQRVTGALLLETPKCRGLMLLHEGRLGAATCETEGRVHLGTEALRVLRRHHISQPEAELWLRVLPAPLVLSLAGVLLGRKSAQQPTFSGIESSEAGYTFVHQGQAVLRVDAELRGDSARYAASPDLPELRLPDEPPGWEQRRYQLTLRGRDALNPMTDVAIEFQRQHGRRGRELLEQLAKGLTLEGVAQLLALELSDLKPWLDKLEQEGLARPLGR